MTKLEAVRQTLLKIVSEAPDEQVAQYLLDFARRYDADGQMYEIWCDDEGACKGRDCESLGYCCTDEEHIACILRCLQSEYKPN